MANTLDVNGLDLIFRQARSFGKWRDEPVEDDVLRAFYNLMKMGPTSANSSPARILFLRSPEAKERLRPALSATNLDKTMAAPMIALVAYDTRFYDLLPRLFPPNPNARSWFAGKDQHAETTAFRNSTLQGAYLIIAARALGFDCGPMSGFDNAKVDAEFFPDGRLKSNFLCCLGRGDPDGLAPRSPRLSFEEACEIL